MTTPRTGTGPLAGLRVVELAGLGPAPLACMLLADLGADVVRVDRPGAQPLSGDPARDLLNRNRRCLSVDLKQPAGRDVVLDLVRRADVLIEGFRPGVTERLGLGPDDCAAVNPRLVYGRMTGWGQDGPLAQRAGHDIDYIALTGALHATARPGQRPTPPLNLLGDFGGGALFLAFGVLAAVLEARGSGQGQVVDAAIVDGTAVLATMIWSLRDQGLWRDEPATNLLDGGAPFYDVYECADGGHLAVGALEQRFYAELVKHSGAELDPAQQYDARTWPQQRETLAALFRTRARDEWAAVFAGTDACVAPVLEWSEAPAHPHLAERATFTETGGVPQPAPAPRFSRTPAPAVRPPRAADADTESVLDELGLDLATLRDQGVVP
ncbi:CaiB/BaiF CoA transferase family protein [Spongisporangium articulatum]|uniref:CaiB/BaiF CoA transferase family protein n=1 Tax=Spongisporangium articulatum TaxID=3362603 RepID=A0ABW8ALS6_9ACTN